MPFLFSSEVSIMKTLSAVPGFRALIVALVTALAAGAPASAHAGGHGGGGRGGGFGFHGGGGFHAGHGYRGGFGGRYGGRYGGWYGGYGFGGWGWPGYGLFLATLPYDYSTYWWDSVPYYYADDNYYLRDGSVGEVGEYQGVDSPSGMLTQG